MFFYEAPYPTATFTSTIIPQLKHSLSLTLQHYFPVSGNLSWPQDSLKPFIEHDTGDAVSFTVAESQADFYYFTGDSYQRAEGQGGDLTLKPELTPFHNRLLIKNQAEIERAYLKGWMDQGGPNNKSLKLWELKAPSDIMHGTFIMTLASIEKIKNWVCWRYQEKHKEGVGFHLSSYTITSAFVWVCLTRAQRMRSEKASLVISVNCRSRLDPPLPSTYFGNCVLFRMAEAKTEDFMGEDGVVIAAQAIGEAIGSLRDGVLDGAEEWIHKLFSIQTDGLYSVSGSSSFQHYSTDFGWGRPKKVELVSIAKGGAFSISDCRDADGGVEIGVALTKTEIESFGSLFASSSEAH